MQRLKYNQIMAHSENLLPGRGWPTCAKMSLVPVAQMWISNLEGHYPINLEESSPKYFSILCRFQNKIIFY